MKKKKRGGGARELMHQMMEAQEHQKKAFVPRPCGGPQKTGIPGAFNVQQIKCKDPEG